MPLNRAAEQVNAQEVSGSRCGGAAALFCCTGEKLLQTASQSSLNISYPKGNHNSIYFFTKCQAAEILRCLAALLEGALTPYLHIAKLQFPLELQPAGGWQMHPQFWGMSSSLSL